jgi:hypothetical protein
MVGLSHVCLKIWRVGRRDVKFSRFEFPAKCEEGKKVLLVNAYLSSSALLKETRIDIAGVMPTASPSIMPPSPPRRSGRQCVSTVVQIDGYTVRKENNYVVRGHGYHFGDNTTQEVPQQAPLRRAPTKQPKKPRVVTPIETGRLQQKDAIQQHVASHSNRRLAYLARHLPILSPFLDVATAAKLQQHIATLPHDEQDADLHVSDDVAQPKLIQVMLRDYQLVGLNWMVRMDKLNLGMIL